MRLQQLARADRQDVYQRSVIQSGSHYTTNGGAISGIEKIGFRRGKFEPKKVGGLERTHRIIRGNERRESVYDMNAKVLWMAAREERSSSQREARKAKRR